MVCKLVYPLGENRWRMFEEIVLWRIFGNKSEEVVQQHIGMTSCWFCTFCRILFRWLNRRGYNDRYTRQRVGEKNYLINLNRADPSGSAVSGVGLRPLPCWDCVFESRRRHGCLCFVSVECCQVEVPATGFSLVQRGPTECCVAKYDREALITRRPWSTRDCLVMETEIKWLSFILRQSLVDESMYMYNLCHI